MNTAQVTLSQDQIEAYYHDHFVASQVRNYQSLVTPCLPRPRAAAQYSFDASFGNLAGRLIYAITSSRTLSRMAAAVSRWVPSLRANIFGVGVRFRARDEWCRIFEGLDYQVAASVRGPEEGVSAARRLLLIRSCRRDSFLLAPASPTPKA